MCLGMFREACRTLALRFLFMLLSAICSNMKRRRTYNRVRTDLLSLDNYLNYLKLLPLQGFQISYSRH